MTPRPRSGKRSRMREVRERLGLTQAQLAEKLGLTLEGVERIERRETRLRGFHLQALEALERSQGDLHVAAGEETLPGPLLRPRVADEKPTPLSLLAGARELAAGLDLLARHGSEVSPRGAALLAGQAVELTLKAYLMTRGWKKKDLKDEVRHDLELAWITARREGLPLPSDVPEWCANLNTIHDDPYRGRYPVHNEGLVITSPEELHRKVVGLIAMVQLGGV